MNKKIKDIDIDAVFTRERMDRICEKLKIPIENRESFFEDVKKSLKLYKEKVVKSITSKAQKQALEIIHKKCYQILEKTELVYSGFVADLLHPTEAEEEKMREFIKDDVEDLIKAIYALPEEIIAFLEGSMKRLPSIEPSIEEKLRTPLLQHQTVRLLCGLCVSGGYPKKPPKW